MQWTGKKERLSFDVPTTSLHVHEKIDPRSVIQAIRQRNSIDYTQMSLFHSSRQDDVKTKRCIEFYKHEKLWSNRLIAGDSLIVMNSLLEKEGMAGKVQCVYIDPPYGIKYASNFQPFVGKREVKDKDEDLASRPEVIKAFRDTWELGIHSYLTYMRDRLLLARELLTDSGSCFVQISDENVHLVRNLMDEVFGVKNFIRMITFAKTGSMTSNQLSRTSDYLLWFCKNKSDKHDQPKYRQLFRRKLPDSFYSNVELADGTCRKITKAEKADPSCLPKGSKVFREVSLESPGASKQDTPFEFEGEVFRPNKNSHWKLSYPNRMNALKQSSRILKSGNKLKWKYYLDDYPLKIMSEVWRDTAGFNPDQRYVVETRSKVIERCILMTTDPGDIVLDPTCGSGTAAYVAEKWGRRWITCDTSRVAITLAKQRLMTADFKYYNLKDENNGIKSGFNYETASHATLKSIANNESPKPEVLYDKPKIDNTKVRVTGPFTVESIPGYHAQPLPSDIKYKKHSIKVEWLDFLRKNGIRGKRGEKIEFISLELLSNAKFIHAEGYTKETKKEESKKALVCFGHEFAPMDQRQIEEGIKEAKQFKPNLIIFCAFEFGPSVVGDKDYFDADHSFNLLKVQMDSDFLTKDLKKKTIGEGFWLLGQPDVSISKQGNEFVVQIEGFDYYNSRTNKIESGEKDKIAVWMLDTDYDGKSIYPRQVFFPMSSDKHNWSRLKKSLKSELDENLVDQFKGTKSMPFASGKHNKIAVKIVDDRGIESLVVKTLNLQ